MGRGHLCVAIHIGERIRVDGEHFEGAFTDADAVLDQEVDELVAVDEGDRSGPAREGDLLPVLFEKREVAMMVPREGVKKVERATEGVEVLTLDRTLVTLGLDDLANRGDAEFDLRNNVHATVVRAARHLDILVVHLLQ